MNYKIIQTHPDHAQALEDLQVLVFPQLNDEERFGAEHYRHHVTLFPDGQFVAVSDDGEVVGMTTTIRLNVDFEHVADHCFSDIMRGGWLSSHDPEGAWLYGADIGVHPGWRRRGMARALYDARQEVVERLRLDGQVTVGLLNGYNKAGRELGLTIEEYFDEIVDVNGELEDPTVSAQERIGFVAKALVTDYLDDPTCGNAGVLLVWEAEE